MKRTRGLWISIAFVLALVAASLAALMAGTRPVLGLDLEGGVSVILSAPDGTPSEVMDRALENIRKRIDAFGTAEPTLFVTGTTIEVQIPGLARGTIEEQAKKQYCLVGEGSESFGCFSTQGDGQAQLNAVVVKPLVQSVCLTGDVFGTSAPCFGTKKDAETAIDSIAVEPSTDPATTGQFLLTGTGLGTDRCFPRRRRPTRRSPDRHRDHADVVPARRGRHHARERPRRGVSAQEGARPSSMRSPSGVGLPVLRRPPPG
jgi:hypothetical protein